MFHANCLKKCLCISIILFTSQQDFFDSRLIFCFWKCKIFIFTRVHNIDSRYCAFSAIAKSTIVCYMEPLENLYKWCKLVHEARRGPKKFKENRPPGLRMLFIREN